MRGPILLVEDDENDLFFMSEAFKKAGIKNVRFAQDGHEALEYLRKSCDAEHRESNPLPELVMLDLKLPYVMGLDVLKCIRQELRLPTVVIILSASREEADVSAAYELGANAYLVKPSDMTRLMEIVQALKLFWLGHNTCPTVK